ncbi:MAG: hypothetical protein Q9227_007935 [Pyrenula ochraceoflavens]
MRLALASIVRSLALGGMEWLKKLGAPGFKDKERRANVLAVNIGLEERKDEEKSRRFRRLHLSQYLDPITINARHPRVQAPVSTSHSLPKRLVPICFCPPNACGEVPQPIHYIPDPVARLVDTAARCRFPHVLPIGSIP